MRRVRGETLGDIAAREASAEDAHDPGSQVSDKSPLGVLSELGRASTILAEWVDLLVQNRPEDSLSFLASNFTTLATRTNVDLLRLAARNTPAWPPIEAHAFLLQRARGGLPYAVSLFHNPDQLHGEITAAAEGGNEGSAIECAAWWVQRHPGSAPAWFYASLAAVSTLPTSYARSFMTNCAATAPTASQVESGLRTIAEYQQLSGLTNRRRGNSLHCSAARPALESWPVGAVLRMAACL